MATVLPIPSEQIPITMAVGAFFALLPDVDHPATPLRRKMGIVGHVGLFWLKHRGLTHTLLALWVVALVAWRLLPLPLALTVVAAYASHLLADMATVSGLPIFWPSNRKNWHILPKRFCITTNTLPEHLLAALLTFLIGVQTFAVLGIKLPRLFG